MVVLVAKSNDSSKRLSVLPSITSPGQTTFCCVSVTTPPLVTRNNSSSSSCNMFSLFATRCVTRQSLSVCVLFSVASGTPVSGLSRWMIVDTNNFGFATTSFLPGKEATGWVTSGTSTTLIDSTKSWYRNQWVGCRVRISSGSVIGSWGIVTANDATTITASSSWANGYPDSTCKYEIQDVYGICTSSNVAGTVTDTRKNWPINSLAGKRIKFIGGTGIYGTDYSITSNTATVLTTSGGQSTDITTIYSIVDVPVKATGIIIHWLYGLTDTTKRCRKMIVFRGGASSLFDIYDITTNKWELAPAMVPTLTTTFTGGSMSCYDGGDNLYLTKEATGRVYRLNLADRSMVACTTTPYAHGTATIGNRMEIIRTADNLRYLYIMRHSGSEMWRTLVFW